MNLRELRAFVAVAEELSFTRAAEKLHIAQSPLSQQIRRLERDLGVPLLVRTTRSVELTAAGQTLLERLRPSLNATEQALAAAIRTGRGDHGTIAVGFTASATYRYLPRIVELFERHTTGVSLDLHTELFTPEQAEQIRSGVLAVAILRPPIRESGIHSEILTNELLIVALPQGHPLAVRSAVRWRDLRDDRFISYPPEPVSTIHTKILNACIGVGFIPQARHYVSNSAAMLSMVAAGVGVAVVPDSMQALKLDGVVFRQLISPTVSIELALAYRDDASDPAVLRFAEATRQVVTAT